MGSKSTLEAFGEVKYEKPAETMTLGTRFCIYSALLELADFGGGKGRNEEKEVGTVLTSTPSTGKSEGVVMLGALGLVH